MLIKQLAYATTNTSSPSTTTPKPPPEPSKYLWSRADPGREHDRLNRWKHAVSAAGEIRYPPVPTFRVSAEYCSVLPVLRQDVGPNYESTSVSMDLTDLDAYRKMTLVSDSYRLPARLESSRLRTVLARLVRGR